MSFIKIENIPKKFISNIIKLNPNYKLKLYDDKLCAEYIKKYYDSSLYNLFNKIKWGPIKSDIFRVCVVYNEGGIYSDIDHIFYKSFDNIIDKSSNMIVCTSYNLTEINPAILGSFPKNPLIKDCLNVYKWIYDDVQTVKKIDSYWFGSIVKIMSFVFDKRNIKFTNYSKSIITKHPAINKLLKIQLLNEIWDNKTQDFILYNIYRLLHLINCLLKSKKRRNLTNIIQNKEIIACLHSEFYDDKLTPK